MNILEHLHSKENRKKILNEKIQYNCICRALVFCVTSIQIESFIVLLGRDSTFT